MFEGWRQRWTAAAGERPDAGDELAEVKRLGEIVIGAEPEPFDPVLDRVGGGQHQHATLGALGYERAADLIAVHHGEVAVEHDHVIWDDSGARQRVAAVVGDVDGDPLTPQPRRDRLGQHFVIFDK